MSIINIVIFTIASIFVLLLFFTVFSTKSKPSELLKYPFSAPVGSSPFFGAQIDDEEQLTDDNETKFNNDYDYKNKEIVSLEKALNLCISNRTKLNNAIQKFRDEMMNTANDKYKIKQKEVKDCDGIINSRLDNYINAYTKLYGKKITRQEVINKIATGTLNVD